MSEIPASDLHRKWIRDDPAYRAEYEALDEEFNLASALIEARCRAGLTQGQLAQRMKTTQAAIARLEHAHVEARVGRRQTLDRGDAAFQSGADGVCDRAAGDCRLDRHAGKASAG